MSKTFGTPGPRAVWPDVTTSRSLERCGILANLLFLRLIAQADDQGRLLGDARHVKLQCVPFVDEATESTIITSLGELSDAGTILHYSIDGAEYIQLVNWWRYQNGARRQYASRYPSPPGWTDMVYGMEGMPTNFKSAQQEANSRVPAAERREARHDAAMPVPVPVPVSLPDSCSSPTSLPAHVAERPPGDAAAPVAQVPGAVTSMDVPPTVPPTWVALGMRFGSNRTYGDSD